MTLQEKIYEVVIKSGRYGNILEYGDEEDIKTNIFMNNINVFLEASDEEAAEYKASMSERYNG